MSSYASMRDDVVMNVCTVVDNDVCVVTMRSDEHEDFPDREGGLFDECVRPLVSAAALLGSPVSLLLPLLCEKAAGGFAPPCFYHKPPAAAVATWRAK